MIVVTKKLVSYLQKHHFISHSWCAYSDDNSSPVYIGIFIPNCFCYRIEWPRVDYGCGHIYSTVAHYIDHFHNDCIREGWTFNLKVSEIILFTFIFCLIARWYNSRSYSITTIITVCYKCIYKRTRLLKV